MRFLRVLTSLKLTLVGMVLLVIGAGLTYDNRINAPVWVLIVPLTLLAVNLTATIFTNQRIYRQGGLLVFHIGLLALTVLAAVGRLTYLDAHLEIAQEQEFTPDILLEAKRGVLHTGNLDRVHFTQGKYTVEYEAGMQRGVTHSEVLVADQQGKMTPRDVGDDRPLVLEGYRFYTTFNKGFAVLLTWTPDHGDPITGRVNMPSYPLYDYKQDNHWTPPGGAPIKFWLQLDTGLREDADWVFDPERAHGTLVVSEGARRMELKPGESVPLQGGALRYERLMAWMGYKVFYDPTLRWMFFIAILTVCGMAWHYWQKMGSKFWPEALQSAGTEAQSSQSGDRHGQ